MWSHQNRFKTSLCMMLTALALPVFAQTYPTKPIRFIVGFAPGGPNDIVARIVGQKLSESLGVPIPVDNRPGADSMIGTQMTARSAPDGYTMGLISASATIHPSVSSNLPYDVEKDFSPVTVLASTPFIVVVNSSVPATSIKELIALAKAKPGQLNFATSGVGGSLHLAGELFKSLAHVSINSVSYKGGAPAINDVVGGQVELMFSPMGIATPFIKAGRLRALAVTSSKRWPSVPELPTVAESGLTGYDATGWYGLVMPAHSPRAIVMRLNQEVVKILAAPDVRQRLASFDLEPVGNSPEQMAAHIKSEIAKWAKVAADAKLQRTTLF
jgi:tripartite-type tricarboxylate transporter receptor subunit TctC